MIPAGEQRHALGVAWVSLQPAAAWWWWRQRRKQPWRRTSCAVPGLQRLPPSPAAWAPSATAAAEAAAPAAARPRRQTDNSIEAGILRGRVHDMVHKHFRRWKACLPEGRRRLSQASKPDRKCGGGWARSGLARRFPSTPAAAPTHRRPAVGNEPPRWSPFPLHPTSAYFHLP